MLVFHDPEQTVAFAHDNGVVLLQQIATSDSPKRYLKKLPKGGWKAVKGSYVSDGGEHVLFDAMYSQRTTTQTKHGLRRCRGLMLAHCRRLALAWHLGLPP